MSSLKTVVSLFALIAAGSGIAVALDNRQDVAESSTPDVLLERLRPGAVIEQYVAQLVGELRQADREGDGLDSDDIKLSHDLSEAQSRASAASEVLRQDLDGDLVTTRSEVERATMRANRDPGRQGDGQFDRVDANRDGKITIAEAIAARRDRRPADRLDALLALDPNRDGKLMARELRLLAEQTFAGIDSNGDETISAEEFRPLAETIRAAQIARTAPVCSLPALPEGARLVAFGAYEGDAISSAVIGGPDEETNLIDVTIEPGSQPLYLVLTSYESMIWRLSGATNRVSRVVVTSHGSDGGASHSGVMGLPAGKVSIGDPGCPRYFYKTGTESAAIAATLRRTLGRDPDAIFGSYSLQRVSLPSGQITMAERASAPAPRGFDAEMWRDATRYWRAGLVTVDPGKVVAKSKVEPYKVLPSQMGLAQLVGSGAIRRLPDGSFKIVRPIPHMPPSMGGAHSVKLIVAKGVPLPPGDPVHSCVTIEESGHSSGATCRRSE